ncbi:MAG: hypothetical protein PHS73_02665 [Candidatus Peribacteraceae bacterium]|nr:hypothetical protein [Candidatus Peribacteraceae bacterium]
MSDFTQSLQAGQNLSEEQQVKLGQSTPAAMSAGHEQFLKTILTLIDSGEIDVLQPETYLNKSVYDALSEEEQNKVDAALMNIAGILTHIVDFRVSKFTPDASPELQSMIDHLWQMKSRIEEKEDVFKF